MALARTNLFFRAVGPVLWRKRTVKVFCSTGEEGGENNGLYANSEHTRCCKCGMVVGNEGRCALGWDGGATPTNGSHTLTGGFQVVHLKKTSKLCTRKFNTKHQNCVPEVLVVQ